MSKGSINYVIKRMVCKKNRDFFVNGLEKENQSKLQGYILCKILRS